MKSDMEALCPTDMEVDKNQIDQLISILSLAKENGFDSHNSTPAVEILDAITDMSQILGRLLNSPEAPGQKLNQGVKELDVADDLGNQKMIRVGPKSSRPLYDPKAGVFFFWILPILCVSLKSRKPFEDCLVQMIEDYQERFGLPIDKLLAKGLSFYSSLPTRSQLESQYNQKSDRDTESKLDVEVKTPLFSLNLKSLRAQRKAVDDDRTRQAIQSQKERMTSQIQKNKKKDAQKPMR